MNQFRQITVGAGGCTDFFFALSSGTSDCVLLQQERQKRERAVIAIRRWAGKPVMILGLLLAAHGALAEAQPSVASNAGASARSSAENSTATAAGWSAADSAERSAGSGPGGYIAGSTAGAFTRSLVSGLFAKRHASETTATGPSGATITTASGQSLQTIADMTIETVSIDPAPVPAGRFEIPASYRKLTPAAAKTDETSSCPST